MDKALGLLGLARRGGRIELGEDAVSGACRSGHGRLLLLASDAGDSVCHRAEYLVRGGKPPLLRLPYTKEALGGALGRSVCPIAALTDVELALAFVRALDAPDEHSELLSLLETAAARVEKRRQEEKAHRKNLHRKSSKS